MNDLNEKKEVKMEDLIFDTTNEKIEYLKPKINSGEYKFKVKDIKQTKDKSRTNFILDIVGQEFEGKQVSLVWSAPANDEYSPSTNVGKLLLSMGFDLGTLINGSDMIGKVGKCIVNDYTKQIDGNVTTYSVIGELVIPSISTEDVISEYN